MYECNQRAMAALAQAISHQRSDGRQSIKLSHLNRVGDVAQVVLCLLLQRLARDGLERLLDIDGFLGTGLKVRDSALLLAPRKRALLRHNALVLPASRVGTWSGGTCRARSCMHLSILLPSTTKGKLSGSRGPACQTFGSKHRAKRQRRRRRTCIKNSSRQLLRLSKVLSTLTSNTSTQQSAPARERVKANAACTRAQGGGGGGRHLCRRRHRGTESALGLRYPIFAS